MDGRVNWRDLARRSLPFVAAATVGFLAAYLFVAFVVFPPEIIPDDQTVPNVVGMELETASERLTRAGFRPISGESRFHASAPENAVVEQVPAAGSREPRGTRVTLAVSMGQRRATVPVVAGLDRAQATDALRAAGFTVGTVTQEASNQPRGVVIASRPRANTTVLLPTTVELTLSGGPSVVEVPDVVGQDFRAARDSLEMLGLRVGRVDIDRDAWEVANTILAQDPPPGETVGAGTRISLTISGRTQ